MAFSHLKNVSLAGISAVVPQATVNNNEALHFIDESEKNKIISVTGIQQRHTLNGKMLASDYCAVAAEHLLKKLQWKREEVALLIFVSQSRDYILPNTAHVIHQALSLSKNCMVFDVPLGCSGYVYGLHIAASLAYAHRYHKVLLLCGESPAAVVSNEDKTALPLFGDAGTATALQYDKNGNTEWYFNLQSDGSGYKHLWVKAGAFRQPFYDKALTHIAPGIDKNDYHLIIDGVKIFEFSIQEVAANILSLEAHYNIDVLNNLDYFVMHQANFLINDTIRKQLKITADKILYSLSHYGNTSSASIPLSLVVNKQHFLTSHNYSLLFSGFGAGLSWGSVYLNNTPVNCLDLIEISYSDKQ